MSSTQEKLEEKIFNLVYQWGRVGIVADHTAPTYVAYIQELIDSAKREGAIEIRNLYGSPKCEALHHPKKYQHTAFEDCPVEKKINALTEQSEESE